MNKNIVLMAALPLAIALTAPLTGCVGGNAVTAKLMKFNLEAVDNRYGRGGLNILLAPVYGITVAVDYVIINSIGFWSGKNPITGKPHIFDTKTKTMINVNDDLDPSLKEAPIDPLSKIDTDERKVYSATVTEVNNDTLDFDIVYSNGESVTLRGKKDGEVVSFYLDGALITKATMDELKGFSVPQT